MTAKQKQWCEEYVKCYNAKKAYMIIYNATEVVADKNAYKNMKDPACQEYIKILQAEALKHYGDMAEILAKELMDDVLYRDEDGKHSSTWTKSADLLQKQLGVQNQKIDVSAEKGITINITGGDE